jgi:phosphatidylglycerol:prolipoprotein diacylglycerol transferase
MVIGAIYWSRIARRDRRLVTIYFFALVGAFVGAKIVYFAAEGYQHIGAPDFWLQLATGKSILGGLLGGYITVEITKRVVRYPGVTGDWFALIAPIGILLGRIGCLVQGCCRGISCRQSWYTIQDSNGISRWPSVPVEILFNASPSPLFSSSANAIFCAANTSIST